MATALLALRTKKLRQPGRARGPPERPYHGTLSVTPAQPGSLTSKSLRRERRFDWAPRVVHPFAEDAAGASSPGHVPREAYWRVFLTDCNARPRRCACSAPADGSRDPLWHQRFRHERAIRPPASAAPMPRGTAGSPRFLQSRQAFRCTHPASGRTSGIVQRCVDPEEEHCVGPVRDLVLERDALEVGADDVGGPVLSRYFCTICSPMHAQKSSCASMAGYLVTHSLTVFALCSLN